MRIQILDCLEKVRLLAEFERKFSAIVEKQEPPPSAFQMTQFVEFLVALEETCEQIDLVFSAQHSILADLWRLAFGTSQSKECQAR